ncbi:MAG: hypothetical protein KBD10_02255 [Candidatus Pacebacteria bacterium]|nr:hypothetical protein [Candidatus Paceibacterota bacterium]
MKESKIQPGLYDRLEELEKLRVCLEMGKNINDKEFREMRLGKLSGVRTFDSFETLLSSIQELCYQCYWFGINPLPQLRKLFPKFEWFYVCVEEESITYEVRAIDPEYVFSIDCTNNAVVVARKKGHKSSSEFKIFIPSESDLTENIEFISSFEDAGYKSVYAFVV